MSGELPKRYRSGGRDGGKIISVRSGSRIRKHGFDQSEEVLGFVDSLTISKFLVLKP